jgi:hypothetical protein
MLSRFNDSLLRIQLSELNLCLGLLNGSGLALTELKELLRGLERVMKELGREDRRCSVLGESRRERECGLTEEEREVGTVGGSAAPVRPSTSSSSRPTPYSTPNPGDGFCLRMDVELATEVDWKERRLLVSETRSGGGGFGDASASVSRELMMEERTAGLAGLDLMRLLERLPGCVDGGAIESGG